MWFDVRTEHAARTAVAAALADKIGTLSPEAAKGVSEAYNIIAGFRLLLTSMSSDAFLQAPDVAQVAKITWWPISVSRKRPH